MVDPAEQAAASAENEPSDGSTVENELSGWYNLSIRGRNILNRT